ncbi:MAG: aspartate carbamoyltransferase [Clostridiales bacterium]|nr:aspartate carbamoyltransferase [Clostridiales bacterium]
MVLKGKHLLNSTDFSVDEIFSLICLAEKIASNPEKYSEKCRGKIMASLFYEPSTRTRLSFDAAMKRLGGAVIGFSDPVVSSHSKGETIEDTVRTVECYSDIVVVRHPEPFRPHKLSRYILIPLINAGDGPNQHPTQTLTDLFTIYHYKKRLSGLKIGLCGDLKYGRTVHSLIKAMDRYDNNSFVCISLDNLKLPEEISKEISSEIIESSELEISMHDLDILYMTRIQKERFETIEEYENSKGCYILTRDKLDFAKEDTIIMHPLPRVDEIHENVDEDKRAVYFNQAKAGMYIRMALIMMLLGISD